MADHNAYYEMLARRAAKAALLRLRYDASDLPDVYPHVMRLIDQHIEKYK